jgi:hypothetical protein
MLAWAVEHPVPTIPVGGWKPRGGELGGLSHVPPPWCMTVVVTVVVSEGVLVVSVLDGVLVVSVLDGVVNVVPVVSPGVVKVVVSVNDEWWWCELLSEVVVNVVWWNDEWVELSTELSDELVVGMLDDAGALEAALLDAALLLPLAGALEDDADVGALEDAPLDGPEMLMPLVAPLPLWPLLLPLAPPSAPPANPSPRTEASKFPPSLAAVAHAADATAVTRSGARRKERVSFMGAKGRPRRGVAQPGARRPNGRRLRHGRAARRWKVPPQPTPAATRQGLAPGPVLAQRRFVTYAAPFPCMLRGVFRPGRLLGAGPDTTRLEAHHHVDRTHSQFRWPCR